MICLTYPMMLTGTMPSSLGPSCASMGYTYAGAVHAIHTAVHMKPKNRYKKFSKRPPEEGRMSWRIG